MEKSEKRTVSKYKKIIRLAAIIICGIILGVNVYMLNANNLVGNKLPTPFGYGAAVVLSGSMEPEFSQGDLIIVKEADEYNVKDIVVYEDGNSLVVHRIVSIDDDEVITKGDANNAADDPIEISAIRAKVVFWIPSAGKVVTFLKTPIGIFLTIAVAIALIEIPRIIDRKKDDEERHRIIEEIEKLKNETYGK